MSRMGAMVRRLYADELKTTADKSTRASRPAKEKRRWAGTKRRLTRLKQSLFRRRSVVWVIRIAAVLAVIFVIAETAYQFNLLTSWHTTVLARRAGVYRELRRRQNLIPNLVYAVSEYAVYERGVFRHVSDAREALQMTQSGAASAGPAGSILEKVLPKLIALAEEYPDLKTSNAIQDLIREAAETENRIAAAKQEYNKQAETYNQFRTIVPGRWFAYVFGFKAAEYVGLDEDIEVPTIILDVAKRDPVLSSGQ